VRETLASTGKKAGWTAEIMAGTLKRKIILLGVTESNKKERKNVGKQERKLAGLHKTT
jgi:hypothetical protein